MHKMDQAAKMELKVGQQTHEVSPLLFGLFLEDISFSCDGGLNSNKICNHSFDGTYMEKSYDQMEAIRTKKPPETYEDHLRFWDLEGGLMESRKDQPASDSNPWYAQIAVESLAFLKNKGYDGGLMHQGECTIGMQAGHTYHFSAYLRNAGYEGTITVYVEGEDGTRLTDSAELPLTAQWRGTNAALLAQASQRGRLVVELKGSGKVDIDCVILADTDVWGAKDSKWSGGHFRRDMVEALKELKPRFMRFPGGCIVEGVYMGNQYQWKHTIGPVIDRIPEINLWSGVTQDKGYCQSYQIGFYEYFLLCEDLQMEPLPIVWAGLNCQFRSVEVLDTESDAFMEQVVQNALDLIEYANGDPDSNEWAKRRAAAGHPEPFHMKMMGIGNENYGNDYHQKFELVKKAIHEKYPEIKCIMSSGAFPEGEDFEETWHVAKEKFPDVCIDEHFYKSNEWVCEQAGRYDAYPRDTAKVFLGEYAANDLFTQHKTNTFGSALAEAAFLTGMERNSDVVVMSSYAPLFAMSEGMQWMHNLIWFNAEYIMKTPNFYVQEMFGAHIGTAVCELVGAIPENVYAVATEDEEKIYVKIVNTDSRDRELNLSAGNRAVKEYRHISLQSDDLDCANELDFYKEPVYRVTPSQENGFTAHEEKVISCGLRGYSVNVLELVK